MGTVKIDENTIKIEEVQPEVRTWVTYNRWSLEEQIRNIIVERDVYVANRNSEIERHQAILDEMDKLGIKSQ